MKLQLLKVKIDKDKLLEAPETERAFYLKAMNFLTDSSILQKSCWHSLPNENETDGLKLSAATTQALFFLRHLSGLLWEGYKLIRTGFLTTRLGQNYQIKELEPIRKYFSNKENLIQKIRNKLAFHFDSELIPNELEKISDQHEFMIYLVPNGMETRNNFYKAGDDILQFALRRMANKEYPIILNEILGMVTQFQFFFEEFIVIFQAKYLGFEKESIAIDIPKRNEVNIPYFASRG